MYRPALTALCDHVTIVINTKQTAINPLLILHIHKELTSSENEQEAIDNSSRMINKLCNKICHT